MKTEESITHLKLPFYFDEKELLKDLKTAILHNWTPHFNSGGYEGEWNIISLYAKDGNERNIFAMGNESIELKPTPFMKLCPYFQKVIEQFQCLFLSVRLMKLGPGSEIKPHRDHAAGYEDGIFRLHIPITTHEEVYFILNGKRLIMQPGECWYTNVNFIHSVANKGSSDRVHLVIDGQRNDWSDELFFSLAPEAHFFPGTEESYPPEVLKRMIEELKERREPAIDALIEELEEKLKRYR